MSHISSIAAAVYTDLAVAFAANTGGVATATAFPTTAGTLQALFATATGNATYIRATDIRSFPAVGTPANIVNVPVYGQKVSQTIGGQANAPTMDVTVNYIPSNWAKGTTQSTWTAGVPTVHGSELANLVADGVKRVWRLTLLATLPTGTPGASQGLYDSNAGGVGTVENTQFYWHGKVESLMVTPSLTDATTAVLSFSIQSDFYGAFTV